MKTGASTRADLQTTAETADSLAQGWYFYGITRGGRIAERLTEGEDDAARNSAAPLQLLEFAGLAAVVKPVRLADFTVAALQERMRSASALEELVQSHNAVIESIHVRQAILPAKFGTVYTHARDVVWALQSAQDVMLAQLDRLEGRDEWAVHLYADRGVMREHISLNDARIRQLRYQCAEARPGRAYFLEQQLREQLEAATQETLLELAQKTFDRLAGCAGIGQVNLTATANDPAGEVEILRASFLVARTHAEQFRSEVQACGEANLSLRCECTGPWPPYSFAALAEEEAG